MTSAVGAVHLGSEIVTVAATTGRNGPQVVRVGGDPSPPAAMYADAAGRLHTGRPADERLGVAIADVRDVVPYEHIVVAGAQWPTDAVLRARLHHPIEAIGAFLGGPPQVLAVPYPDSWSPDAADRFADLVATTGLAAEPVPESVALAAYVRAFGEADRTGATVVAGAGSRVLVVAVAADESTPTQSVDVPLPAHSTVAAADDLVVDVLAAARSIGADTRVVILAGSVVFDTTVRLAFQNYLGRRLQIAEHPVHAVALGAAALIADEVDQVEPLRTFGAVSPADERPTDARHRLPDERRRGVRPIWLVAAGAAVVAGVVSLLVAWSSDDERVVTHEEIVALTRAAVLDDDAFAGMRAGPITDADTSLVCGSVGRTDAEAAFARADAERRLVGAGGDALALRAMYVDSTDDLLHDLVEQLQVCPNGPDNDVRYIVPIPTTGGDPGPPRQRGSRTPSEPPALNTSGADRLGWRGLLARSASPVDAVQNVTCLLDVSGNLVLRACGISLDSPTADRLAEEGLRELLRAQE